MNYLKLIGRSDPLFVNDIESSEQELASIVAGSRFLVLGGAGSIGQAVTKEIFKRNPQRPITKLLHKTFLIIAAIGFVAPIFIAQPNTQNSEIVATENENWENYSPEKLSALLENNEPVFVNMTAAWCITCKVNERTSLSINKTKKIKRHK